MGVHRDFPKSPYAELVPDHRWFPAAEELREKAYERLIPPLVARIRCSRIDRNKKGEPTTLVLGQAAFGAP